MSTIATATSTTTTTKPLKLKLHKKKENSIEMLTFTTAANQMNYQEYYNVVPHEADIGLRNSEHYNSRLRIMETAIAEDSESTTNSPESLPFMPFSASTSFAATTESVLAIGDYFPLQQSVTVSSSAPEYVSLPVRSAATSAASSPKAVINNKFTRKRERVCNNNSNSIVSRMPYFKAFSK